MKDDPTPKQRITLNWSENGKEGVRNSLKIHNRVIKFKDWSTNINDSFQATLWRNITIEFSRNGDLQNYGVRPKNEYIGSISFTTLCHSCFYQIKPILRWVRSRQCMRWRSSMSSKAQRILPQRRYGHVSKYVIAYLCEIIKKILSDNTNQCDCYWICLDDHIQNATLGIPGSCQQVQSRPKSSISKQNCSINCFELFLSNMLQVLLVHRRWQTEDARRAA